MHRLLVVLIVLAALLPGTEARAVGDWYEDSLALEVGTTELNLNAANGIHVDQVLGIGAPPVEIIRTPYAIRDGSAYQRTIVRERVVTIILSAVGGTRLGLHRVRQRILDGAGLVGSIVRLRCTGGGKRLYLDMRYEAGLEGGESEGFAESLGLRFLCCDPIWYELDGMEPPVNTRRAIEGVYRIAERDTDGSWSNLAGGADNEVWSAIYSANDELYAGGYFHNIGGVAALHVAMWDRALATWSPLGAGVDDAVWTFAFGPNGDLYAGGEFVNVAGGGIALNHIGRWRGGAWSALGAGCDSVVIALAVGPDGTLYAGGSFHNAGAGAALHIAKWNGAAWSPVGAGLDDVVQALAVGPDGSLYAGGQFHNVAGGGAAVAHIAKWNPTTSTWSALGAGCDNNVYALAFGPDGTLYAGGAFHTAGGVAALHIARWNGASWAPVGAGFDDEADVLAIDPQGKLYAGGLFANSGTYPLPMKWAQWHNPIWVAGDGNIGPWIITPLAISPTGRVAIGGDFEGTLTYPGENVLVNYGSADAYPIFTFYGPGRLYHLVNYTTDKRLDFNILLLTGEVATLDLRPGYKTFTSNFRGNIIGTVLPGDLVSWSLVPGNNYVSIYLDNNSVSNPSFEAPGGGGADIWQAWTENAGAGALADSATAHSGSHAVKATAGGGGVWDTYVSQDIAVAPGLVTYLRFWDQGDGVHAGRYRVYDVTNGADILALQSTGHTGAFYMETFRTFTIPAGCYSLRIYLYCPAANGGISYFDDVSLWHRGLAAYNWRHLSLDAMAG